MDKLNDKELDDVRDIIEIKEDIETLVEEKKRNSAIWKIVRTFTGYIASAIIGSYALFEVVLKFINYWKTH